MGNLASEVLSFRHLLNFQKVPSKGGELQATVDAIAILFRKGVQYTNNEAEYRVSNNSINGIL